MKLAHKTITQVEKQRTVGNPVISCIPCLLLHLPTFLETTTTLFFSGCTILTSFWFIT